MASQATTRLSAKIRSRAGSTIDLDVLDLSAGGCMVESRSWSAKEGDRVLITLPGLASQPGKLVWIEDGRAGIAFERALHEAVLTHLGSLLPGEEQAGS